MERAQRSSETGRRHKHTLQKCAAGTRRLAVILALLACAGPGCADPPPGFVQPNGTAFSLDGKPFQVAGVNNHYLTFGTREEVLGVLDDAVKMNANVIRIFLQPVIGARDGKSVPTIWNFRSRTYSADEGVKGTYLLYWDTDRNAMGINEGPDGFEKVDFLFAEAAKRNLKLLVAFLDFWDYTGGAQQMRAWYGSTDKFTFFAADPRTRRDYKMWAKYVLERTNALTGVRYKDDPNVFAWELMNEPNITPPTLLRDWIAEMSAYIKSIDPHHMVATGHANLYPWFSDLDIPTIDFGTWHGYPVHWEVSPRVIDETIDKYCSLAKDAGKPMVLEEFGYDRAHPDQTAVYDMWLSSIYDNPDCAGWIVWRLISHQSDGRIPPDTSGGFDIHTQSGPTWETLKAAAQRLQDRPQP